MGVTDNESREIPKRDQKERKLIGMKSAILFSLATLTWASPAPQYSGQTQDLSEGQLDTIKDIFGTDAGDAYSGDQQTGRLEDGSNGVEVIVQVVKNEDGYVAPDDYQQSTGALTDEATSNVDNVFENCADYAMTCQFGQQSGSYSSYWGYSAQQCQTWMNGELSRLNQEVADMQNGLPHWQEEGSSPG